MKTLTIDIQDSFLKEFLNFVQKNQNKILVPVSYTHLRAHETVLDIVCRLLLEKKNKHHNIAYIQI